MAVQTIDLGRVVGADAVISEVRAETLPPGSQATAANLGTPGNAILSLGIPQGPQGETVVPDGSITDASVAEGAAISGSKLADGSVDFAKLAADLQRRIADLEGKAHSLLDDYPVGKYYFSESPTSPASIMGGSWTPVTGRFLYMNSSTASGGSNTHTLSIGEGPSHNHIWYIGGKTMSAVGSTGASGGYGYVLASTSSGSAVSIGSAGGGQPHNNMPAYVSCYAWRRTS